MDITIEIKKPETHDKVRGMAAALGFFAQEISTILSLVFHKNAGGGVVAPRRATRPLRRRGREGTANR